MSGVQTYDDRDPSISYVGDWQKGGTPDEYFQTTTYVRNATGATATFQFTGTSVSVFGTLDSVVYNRGIPVSSYIVDKGQSVVFYGPTPGDTQHKQQFFQSTTLSPGAHSLFITVQSDAGYYLDYFTVTPNPAVVSSSSSSSSSSSTSSTSSVTRTSGSNSTPSVTSGQVVTDSPSSSKSHLGVAVGGSLGGCAILVLALIVAICLRKRRGVDSAERVERSQSQMNTQSLWMQNRPSTSQLSPFVTSQYPQGGINAELGNPMYSRNAPPHPTGSKSSMLMANRPPPVPAAANATWHAPSASLGSTYALGQSTPTTEDMYSSSSAQEGGTLSKGDPRRLSGVTSNPPPDYER